MTPRQILAASLLLAAGLRAEGEPTDHLFPADRDGAPAPIAPLDAPRTEGQRPILREKVAQLRESGITREDMQRVREALEAARGDESVKAARKKADAAQDKLRGALRAYAEAHGVEPPDFPEKFRPEPVKDKPELTPEQVAERKARKQSAVEPSKEKPELTPEQLAERRARRIAESGERKAPFSPEKMAEIRKVMEGARNDPEVKAAFEETRAAGEALRQAVRAAMLKADPSLAPLIEKLGDLREAFRAEHIGPAMVGQGKRGGSEVDKAKAPSMDKPRSPKLAAALEAANGDESVKAARKAAEDAKNKLNAALKAYADANGLGTVDKSDPEAVAAHRKAMEEARNDPAVKAAFEEARAAGEAFHAALKAAVLKSDPSLADEFEKSRPANAPKFEKRAPQKQPGA